MRLGAAKGFPHGLTTLRAAVQIEMNALKQTLVDDGIEIYADEDEKLLIAERVRVHLMDSGVVVAKQSDGRLQVSFVVRSEGTSGLGLGCEGHLAKVRRAVSAPYAEAGYLELEASERPIEDPGDPSRLLDTWYEVRFGKLVDGSEVLEQVRYCLAQPKCV